jgi:hypothetical protein
MDGAGPQSPVASEEGAPLEQVAVILGYEAIPGPHAMLFFQDVENIGSPFTSPALSVFFRDISDQVRETTLSATHAGEACGMVHDPELSSLCPSLSENSMLVCPRYLRTNTTALNELSFCRVIQNPPHPPFSKGGRGGI